LLFQLGNPAAYGGKRDSKLSGRGREPLPLNHGHERLHGFKPSHLIILFWNNGS
jgi:hypothetical protein